MEELVILILLIVILLYMVYHNTDVIDGFISGENENSKEEGFEDKIVLTSCPSEMKTFYLSDGRTACCNGTVIGSRCTGTVQCTMTGEGTNELPSCAKLLKKELDDKAKTHCPSSMPSYFEDKATKQK
jgi:hypothetical protein